MEVSSLVTTLSAAISDPSAYFMNPALEFMLNLVLQHPLFPKKKSIAYFGSY